MKNNGSQKKIEEIELFPRKFGKTALILKSDTDLFPKDGYIVFELNTKPVVVVFAITKDKKVIVVKQYRHAANSYMIEIPGGLSDAGESPEETARRELQEETGFVATDMIQLTDKPVWFDPASVRTPFWPCLALECRNSKKQPPVPNERQEILFFSLSEWFERIQRGEILDAKTIATTFLALKHLNV